MRLRTLSVLAVLSLSPAVADTVFFNTGNPDGKMAAVSQQASGTKIEVETADDFALTAESLISGASFTGLLPTGVPLSDIVGVTVEIYRVFPADSDTSRTSGPPTFSTPLVPTRVNSPSDVELSDRSSSGGTLTFTPGIISSSFTASNSVIEGGIHPKPGDTTTGNGAVTGQEVQFSVLFSTPFDLPADHYFFVPQVELSGNGNFYWLSAPRPIVPPGTPFPAGFTDLQAWTRDQNLDPDWLRIGTDIVGGATPPTFNMTFSLTGTAIPEPSTTVPVALAFLLVAGFSRRKLLSR
ncbi:MAG TPA: PEP-CTERM sorting domain-containing protein [Bryobacteraceae bacterium]